MSVTVIAGRDVPRGRVQLALRVLGLPLSVKCCEIGRNSIEYGIGVGPEGAVVYASHPIVDAVDPWAPLGPLEAVVVDLAGVPVEQRQRLAEAVDRIVDSFRVHDEAPF